MISKLKCPFCGEEIVGVPNLAQTRTIGFRCCNIQCKAFSHFMPVFLLQALIQTKQDLEIAQKALEDIDALLHSREFDITELGRLNIIQYLVSHALKLTEHKEQTC